MKRPGLRWCGEFFNLQAGPARMASGSLRIYETGFHHSRTAAGAAVLKAGDSERTERDIRPLEVFDTLAGESTLLGPGDAYPMPSNHEHVPSAPIVNAAVMASSSSGRTILISFLYTLPSFKPTRIVRYDTDAQRWESRYCKALPMGCSL